MSVVDVLADLRALHVRTNGAAMSEHDGSLVRIDDAIAALGELIEQVQDTLESHPVQLPYPDGPCIERDQRALLQAALARVTGGAA